MSCADVRRFGSPRPTADAGTHVSVGGGQPRDAAKDMLQRLCMLISFAVLPLGPAAALDGETGRLVQHDDRIVAVQDRIPQHGLVEHDP